MKKVTFKQVLVSVLSVLSVGCVATGTSLLSNGNPTVRAATSTVDTQSIVSVQNATVTESVSVGGKNTLKISSATAYSGVFDGTFHGNMDLKYRFPNQYTAGQTVAETGDGNGQFTFTIADARPDYAETNKFTVEIAKVNSEAITYIMYNGSKYASKNGGSSTTATTGNYYAGTAADFNNDSSTYYNKLSLVWDANDVLSVGYYCQRYKMNEGYVVAKFGENAGWNLPTLSFPDGYTISFSSNYAAGLDANGDSTVDDYGTDVCFISLNGGDKLVNSLGNDTIEVASSKTSVMYDGVVQEANDVIEVEQYSSSLKDFTVGTVNTLLPYETIKAGEENSDNPTYETVGYFTQEGAMQTAELSGETVNLNAAGDYAITAQGTPLTVRVLPVVNATSLVTSNADKSIAAITSTSETKGLLVSSKNAYTATINKTFTTGEAFDLRYRFPSQYTADGLANVDHTTYKGDSYGSFRFIVADASNSENKFTVEFHSTATNPSMYVQYGTTKVTTWTNKGYASANATSGGYHGGFYLGYNNDYDNEHYNALILDWDENNVLTVSVNYRWKTSTTEVLAKFDGSTAISTTEPYTWGLPKLSFPNGYTVSFESNYTTGLDVAGDGSVMDYGTDVNLISLNGFAFGQDNYQVELGETTAAINGQKVTAIAEDVTAVDVTTVATYADDNANTFTTALTTKNVAIGAVVDGKVTVSHNPLNQKVAPSVELAVGGQTYTVTYMVNGVAQTATVAENATITLNDATLTNKTFIGWKIGENLYANGDEYTVTGDITITAVGVSFGIVDGAWIRINSTTNGKGGLRFAGYILTEDMADNVTFGMYLNGVKVPANNQLSARSAENLMNVNYNGDNTYFTAVITDLAVANYTTDVEAVTYIAVTYADGDSQEFKTTTVTRNAKQVAERAKADGKEGEMLDKYINGEE